MGFSEFLTETLLIVHSPLGITLNTYVTILNYPYGYSRR